MGANQEWNAYLVRDLYSPYIKNAHNSVINETANLKSEQRIWKTFLQKTQMANSDINPSVLREKQTKATYP